MSDIGAHADPLLSVEGVNTFYGPVQVHFDLTFTVRARADRLPAGRQCQRQVDDDEDHSRPGEAAPRASCASTASRSRGLTTPQIVRRGVGSVPEARRLFGDMSVRENLLMGAYSRKDRRPSPRISIACWALFPKLAERLSQRAGTLSGGEQQMVAMARALMGRPALICMDEPTMGLSPLWVDRVLDLIATINREGVTVFMVEQNASLALEIAHHAYVLQTGRIVLDGPAADLRSDPRIRDAYLGGQEAA